VREKKRCEVTKRGNPTLGTLARKEAKQETPKQKLEKGFTAAKQKASKKGGGGDFVEPRSRAKKREMARKGNRPKRAEKDEKKYPLNLTAKAIAEGGETQAREENR